MPLTHAGQAAARPAGGRDPAGRRHRGRGRSTCASSRPPTATWRGGDARRRASARTSTTASAPSRSRCRRCASGARTSRCSRRACSSAPRSASARRSSAAARAPSSCWSPTPGPATCASCRTRSSARWRWRRPGGAIDARRPVRPRARRARRRASPLPARGADPAPRARGLRARVHRAGARPARRQCVARRSKTLGISRVMLQQEDPRSTVCASRERRCGPRRTVQLAVDGRTPA